MAYSLISSPGQENPAWLNFSDGRLQLLGLYQAQNDPSQQEAEKKPHQVLYWRGTVDSLKDTYKWYRRLVDSVKVIAPEYVWDRTTEVTSYFGSSVPGSNMTGSTKLKVYGLDIIAGREIAAQLKRREKNWNNIRFESTNGLVLVLCGDEVCEIEFSMNVDPPIGRLPIDLLADFIESTKPQAMYYGKSEKKSSDGSELAERRYEPWPLNRPELLVALQEIQKKWCRPLRKRRYT